MSRHRPDISQSDPAETAVRDLCRRLFADPARLVETLSHKIDRPFRIAPHLHRTLLQLDLIDGCRGRAWIDGTWTAISGLTAIVSYPRQEHGYELRHGSEPSRVGLVKIQVAESWPAVAGRMFPTLRTGLSGLGALCGSVQSVIHMGIVRKARSPLLLARLAEMLSLWPRQMQGGEVAAIGELPDEQRGLAAAVAMIDSQTAQPPTMDELATAAHLSVRHFARRFRMAFGCTAHAYITARRLERAKQMLLGHRLKIYEVADSLAFGSVATFSRWFGHHTGTTPTQYRNDPTVY